MYIPTLTSLLTNSLLLTLTTTTTAHPWPAAPFYADGRWILNTEGTHVTYAGVNWPGAADTMLPEGLQFQSISTIVSSIKSLGMNVIRLTYAIEMIDDILDHGGDVDIKTSFVRALGEANGTKVYEMVAEKNPRFHGKTTRLDVFDAVAEECAKQQIYVHLDNHVSQAKWCCSETDGNAWFGDTYFDVAKWKRGLVYMATHAAKWPALTSMSLRNELRQPKDNPTLNANSYGWHDWYTNIRSAATGINNANPHVLIFLSGLNYDTDMTPIPTASSLGGGEVFRNSDFTFANKLVLEIHDYENDIKSCSQLQHSLYTHGFDALNASDPNVKNVMPVLMTEWGHSQDAKTYQSVYATCLHKILPEWKAGWMVWVLAGSYYIREGTQDSDESWGLLNHDWSAWRDPADIENGLKPMVAASLA